MARKGPLHENRSAPPERVLVATKLLSEMRYASVRQALMDQFKIGRSAATRTITMARVLLAQEEEELRPQVRAVTIARLDRIIDRALEDGDHNAAVRGVRELVRIYGLAQPEEVKLTVTDGAEEKMKDLTDEELRALAKIDGGDEVKPPTEH